MEDFELNFALVAGLSQAETDHFWDEFIEQAIASQGLVFGGGGEEQISGMVGSGANDHITVEHRAHVSNWLKNSKKVSVYTIP